MSHLLLKKTVAIFLLLLTFSVNAEEWNFAGSAGVKYQTVDFKVADVSFTPLFVSNNLNFSAFSGDIYLNIDYDISVKDHQELSIDVQEAQFIDMSRSDTHFTFGYLINKSTNVFIGYKLATLDVKLTTVIQPDPVNGNTPRAQNIEFKDEGVFIGGSYTQNIGETGSLNYSIAYADMDGEVTIRGAEFNPVTNSMDVFNDKTTGKTTGLSIGITFNDSFTESSNYYVSLKTNLYEFDDEALTSGDDLSTDETFTIIGVGLRKYF